MGKDNIKLGIALTRTEWQTVLSALDFKIKRAEEMGIVSYAESLVELRDYIKFQTKKGF